MTFLEDRNRREILKKILQLGFVIFLLLGTGTIAYVKLEHWSTIDALYFSTVTLSTIGYGDLSPTTDASKLFTVFYILLGVATMLYIFTILGTYYIQYLESHKPAVEEALKETFNKYVTKVKSDEWVMLKIKDKKQGEEEKKPSLKLKNYFSPKR